MRLFASYFRINKVKRNISLTERGKKMRDQENEFRVNDLALTLFVVIAGWLLLFQSDLF